MATRTANGPSVPGQCSPALDVEPAGATDTPRAAAEPSPSVTICPLFLILTATILGIVIDRELASLETSSWITLAAGSVTAGCLALRRSWLSLLTVLAGVSAFAAGWHHALWNDLADFDVVFSATDRPAPTHLRGVITERIGLHRSAAFSREEPERITTRMVVSVTELSDGSHWRPSAGKVLVSVAGDRTSLHAGLPVEATGKVSRIAGPLNPGEFDYRSFLRAQGIRVRLVIDSPDGISHDESRAVWWGTYWLGRAREISRDRLIERLDPASAPLAAALILGQRQDIDPEVNDAFVRTGTTHLLAISGLQLQALALAIGLLLRLIGFRRRLVYSGVGLVTIGYALLVGFAPSVVRSAVMTLTFCLAACVARPTRPANTLALAGLVTLWWNPFDLFDVGCQLSFLAIAALVWLVPLGRKGLTALGVVTAQRLWGSPPSIQELQRRFEPRWRRTVRAFLSWIGLGVLTSLVVWLAALPLVACRFHLVSPIGVLLNIPLIPLTSIAMLLGAAGLGMSLAWAPLGAPLIGAADWLLRLSEVVVRWGVAQPWGYRFVAGPSWVSILAFYALLGTATVLTRSRPIGLSAGPTAWLRRALPWCAVAASLVPGWLVSWPNGEPRALAGEVLAVDHGLAVCLRLPDGYTLLYDCGKMGDPAVGRRIIAPALWSKGLNHIDAVYLSHADQDHYNALPDLLDRFRIGEVVVPPGFAGARNPGAGSLLDAVRDRGVPVRTISAPAVWSRGGCTFRILHPPAGWHPESTDNARSLVLDVAYQGRHLLLTGDLDQLGVVALASQPALDPPDLMLAPHHGGKTANTATLYNWARPRAVVVSQRMPAVGTNDALSLLDRRGTPLLRTWQRGAVHFRWTPDQIITAGFLKP